jgi:hypothetical protein
LVLTVGKLIKELQRGKQYEAEEEEEEEETN